MSVDIIMRTRNRLPFLERAFDDLSKQAYQDWHLGVVSADDDPQPVIDLIDARGWTDRSTVVDTPSDTIISAMTNAGIRTGSAEFVAVHDDDDTWHPEFLARTVAHLQETGADAVGVRTEIVYEKRVGDQFVETGRKLFHPAMQEITYFDLIRFNHAVPISILMRRAALERIGGADERYEFVEDWVLNMQLAKGGEFDFIDEVLAYWHQRPDESGDGGNSVHARRRIHSLNDRRVRNDAVRQYVAENGDGALLYLSKFIDERTNAVLRRLDVIEENQKQIMELLEELINTPTGMERFKAKFGR